MTDSDDEAPSDAGSDRPVAGIFDSIKDPKTLSQIKRSRIDLARRYVFLCPLMLSKHYDSMPNQAKDVALLVFRCARSQLFSTGGRAQRTAARVDSGVHRPVAASNAGSLAQSSSRASLGPALYRSRYSKEVLQWIQTKEKEGCVFWYKPEKDLRALSRFFEEKIDPVSDAPYLPLLLDADWWRIRFPRKQARYCGATSVVAALSQWHLSGERSQDIDIPTFQELIYQSNPTLEPIVGWPHAPSMRFLPPPKLKIDFGGLDVKKAGYIQTARTKAATAQPRVAKWPGKTSYDRLDNLHGLWQSEEACYVRRQSFALHGQSAVGSLSAR